MKRALRIAGGELTYWRRSGMSITVLLSLIILSVAAAWLSGSRQAAEAANRHAHQHEAHARFLAQPDRHPHRMVHYGHYVFRNATPLSLVDPGVDLFTGRAIFLEGHRQNMPTFAASRETAQLNRFGDLSPAFLVQVVAPLFLVLLGYSGLVREREQGTLPILLAQGVGASTLIAGKVVALAGAAALVLLPLAGAAVVAVSLGESPGTATLLVAGYGVYLLFWVLLISAVSGLTQRRATALASLLVVWLCVAVVIPRLSASTAAMVAPSPPLIEAQLSAQEALRTAGDSHSSDDPAFERLRQRLLEEHGVATVEELPVNWRGVVSTEGETRTSAIFNRFAAEQMAREARQVDIARAFALASPTMAVRRASMALAGTDLETHHRFLIAAETHRYEFVQSLNRLHAEEVNYAADVRRSSDPDSERRTRVSAEHWQLLPEFDFAAAPAADRLDKALAPLLLTGGWLGGAFALLLVARRRTAS